MRTGPVILLTLGLGAVAHARLKRSPRGWFRNLKGWQKILGLIALVMAVVVILNPEFLALGLLGDSTVFEILTLAFSVQMLVSIRAIWHNLSTQTLRALRWLGIPSPGFRFLMASAAVAIASMSSIAQKIAHQIWL